MQLTGTLGDVALELGLVGPQFGFGGGYVIGHRVERFCQLVYFRGSAARGPGAAVAAGHRSDGDCQPAYGKTDAQGERDRDDEHHAEHGGPRHGKRVLRDLR